jgi:hypothetical protein
MSAVEKALKDMVDRRSWEYLKENHTQGTLYRSLDKYEPHIKRLYGELSEQVTRIEQEEKETSERFQDAKKVHGELEAEYENLLRKRGEVSSEIESLEGKNTEAKKHLQNVTSKLEGVQKNLDELGKRHLTSETLTQILESDVESPDELLQRVKTRAEYRILVEKNRLLGESLSEKHEQEQEAASRLKHLLLDIQSEENRLDEVKLRNKLWVDSIKVVNNAQLFGYTPEIIGQLLEALFKISVKGEPIRSARILLRRFEKIKEEIELDDSITNKTAALKSIEARYNEVAGALKAVKKDALSSIKLVENTAKKSLTSVAEAGKRSISAVGSQSGQSIRSIEETSLESVVKVKELGCMALDQLRNDVAKVFMEHSYALQLATETYQGQVLKWGDAKEQAGKFAELIKLATILLGIQQNPDAIQDIEPAIITRLMERIHLYIVRKWPETKTKASRELSSKDWGISSVYMADLSSVSSWLIEALKQLERGGPQ